MKNYVLTGVLLILIIAAVIAYKKRNTLIVMAFNDQLTKNFKLGELLVTSQPFPNIPNEDEKAHLKDLAVNVLQPVRDLLNVPVKVNSAFRSEDVNKSVGGVNNSQHRTGDAADIVPVGMNIWEAFRAIAKSNIPFDQLIIEKNERGNEWIHISYNRNSGRRQLLQAAWNFSKNKMDYKTLTV